MIFALWKQKQSSHILNMALSRRTRIISSTLQDRYVFTLDMTICKRLVCKCHVWLSLITQKVVVGLIPLAPFKLTRWTCLEDAWFDSKMGQTCLKIARDHVWVRSELKYTRKLVYLAYARGLAILTKISRNYQLSKLSVGNQTWRWYFLYL